MKQRFLVIDDDRISRLRLRAALEARSACEVTEVPNLALARSALAAGDFSAIFCDLLLPDGCGFELLASLPVNGPRRFVHTCRVTEETRTQASQHEATFLEKPLDAAVLEAALRPLVAFA